MIARDEVAGEEVGDEAVLGVVGEADRLGVGAERRDRCDGTEDLLARHVGVGRHVGEHGGLVEPAGALRGRPADEDLGALGDGVVDERRDLVTGLLVDERADVDAVLGALAEGEGTHPARELGAELVGQRLVDVEAVGGGARLTHVAHLREHRAVDGLRRRRRPRRRGTGRCRRAPSRPAGSAREACSMSERPTGVEPVKVSLRRRGSRMSGSMTSPRACVVMTTLRTPSGRPHSREQLGEGEHRQRRLAGRLDHHGAAGGDGGPDLARAHREREVPRGDHQRRADGLLHRHAAGSRRWERSTSGPRCAPPPRRTTGRTRRRRRPRRGSRRASCPSRGS